MFDLGQKRRADQRIPMPALLSLADIRGAQGHVGDVPNSDMTWTVEREDSANERLSRLRGYGRASRSAASLRHNIRRPLPRARLHSEFLRGRYPSRPTMAVSTTSPRSKLPCRSRKHRVNSRALRHCVTCGFVFIGLSARHSPLSLVPAMHCCRKCASAPRRTAAPFTAGESKAA